LIVLCPKLAQQLVNEMTVELIWATPNAEPLITRMARVSNPSNADNIETAPKLLRYLIEHEHWSPFQMASMTVSIHTQRDIAAQILRHASFSFQEFSTRYAKAASYTLPDLRRQDTKNRQNSFDDLPNELVRDLTEKMSQVLEQVYDLYEYALDQGVAKETARRILPLCTNTHMYMAGTLRSWIHYIKLRTKVDTQLEHRLIAEQIRDIFWQQFPSIAEAAFGIETKPYYSTNAQLHF
jgi:thymidylate synthase (FAD)